MVWFHHIVMSEWAVWKYLLGLQSITGGYDSEINFGLLILGKSDFMPTCSDQGRILPQIQTCWFRTECRVMIAQNS